MNVGTAAGWAQACDASHPKTGLVTSLELKGTERLSDFIVNVAAGVSLLAAPQCHMRVGCLRLDARFNSYLAAISGVQIEFPFARAVMVEML